MQRPRKDILEDLRGRIRASRQEHAAYARSAGVSQSTVSRLMSGKRSSARSSRALDKLCRYAGVKCDQIVGIDPRESNALMNALAEAWDGTPDRARKLARVIRALNDL